jgi:hypothetical protein
VIYHLDGISARSDPRDRRGLSNGGGDSLNPTNQAFVYNRLMIDDKF